MQNVCDLDTFAFIDQESTAAQSCSQLFEQAGQVRCGLCACN